MAFNRSKNFLESYRQSRNATKHDLLIIFKGFNDRAETREYRERLKPFDYKDFFVSDLGYDLRAYALAARHFDYSHLCFLNSFSVLLADGWLDKMSALAMRPEVGLVGATGSYESMHSNLLLGWIREPKEGGFFATRLGKLFRVGLNRFFFNPFPNYHIRTNAFMLSREVMLKVWPQQILTKKSAYLFENGKHSLTQRILRLNLKVLVVGKDGRGYEKEEWSRSNTFRQSNQENLLIADNQTRQYAGADYETRQYLARLTWGDQANPARP